MYALTLICAGLANGALYALLALGLVLIYKTQDVVDFAHGELFMAGAYIGFTAFQLLGWSYPLAFVLSVAGGALLGVLLELVVIRPVVGHPHVTIAMVTVGVSYTMKGVIRLCYDSDIHTMPPVSNSSVSWGGVVIATQSLINILVAILLTVLILALFQWTRAGLRMRATQQNPRGARVVGIDTGKIYALTWGLAAAIGAAAGFLAAPVTLVYPDMGAQFILKAFAAAVLGGFDSVLGAIVGGFLLGMAELLAGGYISTRLIDVASYLIIILVMIVRPQGLFGRSAVVRV